MTDREKLEELLCNTMKYGCGARCTYPHCFRVRNTADHLIANGVTVQGWIPVTERLPKRGEFVLFSYAKENRNPTMYAKNTMAVGRYDQKMFLVEGCSVKVTHWMPLPQPPKGE